MRHIECTLLRRFFGSVSLSLAKRLRGPRVPGEEFLSGLLGEFLDTNFTSEHVLKYSLADLNRDLQRCGSARSLSIEIQTVEHRRRYESIVSFADFGIRIEVGDGQSKHVRYALIQAKKLFPDGVSYGLGSRYESFDKDQFDSFWRLAKATDDDGTYYLFYNPDLPAFDESSQDRIREFDSERLRPDFRYLQRLMPSPAMEESYAAYFSHVTDVDAYAKHLQEFPGARISGISVVKGVLDQGGQHRLRRTSYKFSLQECYENGGGYFCQDFSDTCNFVPLSLFFVDGLLSFRAGTVNPTVGAIASGTFNPDDPFPSNQKGEKQHGDEPVGVAVRHMLTIRLHQRNRLDQ